MELSHKQAEIRLADIQTELERLGAKEELTVEDEQSFAELTEEYRDTDRHRRKLERDASLEAIRKAAQVGNVTPRDGVQTMVERGSRPPTNPVDGYDRDPILNPDSVEDRRFHNPWDLSEVRTFGRDSGEIAGEFRARALDAIEKMPGTRDNVRAAATDILEQTVDKPDKLARQILLTSSPAYLRAWSKLARGKEHTFTAEERHALDQVEEFRAMSLTDAAGGYLVPFQLDPSVIITSDGSRNDIRQVARVVQATGDVWNGVSSGAVSWSWDAEASQVSDDSTTFAQPTIPNYTARGFVPISIEALQDEANVTAEVARLLAFGKDQLEAPAFATGSGSGQPTGIITALVASSPTVIVTSTTTDTFAIGDVYKVQGALPARYRSDATWLGNNLVYNIVRGFDTSGGGGFWTNLGGDRPAQLIGRGVYEAEAMDGVVNATQENYILVFGDFSNYVITDRIGMTVEFIPHLFSTTNNRPTGQRGWFAYYRTGADSVNDGGFRLLNVT